MKRSRWQCAFSQRRPAEHFCLSLFCFSGLVIASCLLFEQPLQDFLTHLNLYLPSPPRVARLLLQRFGLSAQKNSHMPGLHHDIFRNSENGSIGS